MKYVAGILAGFLYPNVCQAVSIHVGPEAGYHSFDASSLGVEDARDNHVRLLKTYNWTTATGRYSLKTNYSYLGAFGEAIFDKASLGVGYRLFPIGSAVVTASDETYSPYYQWTETSETQTLQFSEIHLSVGFHEIIEKKHRIALKAELGIASAVANDIFTWSGYNGSYFFDSSDFTATANGSWYAFEALAETKFSKNIGGSIGLGYKLVQFASFQVDRISSTFPTYKKGESLKNTNGGNYGVNLNGLLYILKVFWAF